MSFVFEGLIGATITLAILYSLIALYALRQLRHLTRVTSSTTLNTRKLFVMTCLLSCTLRFMSFSSMTIFDLSAIHYAVDSSPSYDDTVTGREEFFEKAFFVLFDFPDFCVISAYSLLMVVWAEAYLQSRRHWLSHLDMKRRWMLGYLVFNVVLYSSQIGLYTLLFFPSVDQNVLSLLIYITLTCFNLVLPLSWLAFYFYLSLKFSGFPYASNNATMRLAKLGYLMAMWTTTRLCWGFVALTSVLQGWLTYISQSEAAATIILIMIFLFTEIIPFFVSIRMSYLEYLAEVGSKPSANKSPIIVSRVSPPTFNPMMAQPQNSSFASLSSSSSNTRLMPDPANPVYGSLQDRLSASVPAGSSINRGLAHHRAKSPDPTAPNTTPSPSSADKHSDRSDSNSFASAHSFPSITWTGDDLFLDAPTTDLGRGAGPNSSSATDLSVFDRYHAGRNDPTAEDDYLQKYDLFRDDDSSTTGTVVTALPGEGSIGGSISTYPSAASAGGVDNAAKKRQSWSYWMGLS